MIIYRNKETKKITGYSLFKSDNLDERIIEFNSNEKNDRIAEIVSSNDLQALIEIAENNKKLKERDLKYIEDSINDLQNELYNLKDRL